MFVMCHFLLNICNGKCTWVPGFPFALMRLGIVYSGAYKLLVYYNILYQYSGYKRPTVYYDTLVLQ